MRGCFDHMMKGYIESQYCVPLHYIKKMEVNKNHFYTKKTKKRHIIMMGMSSYA